MKISSTKIGNMLTVLLFAGLSLNVACATGSKVPVKNANSLTQDYVWYDGDREHKVWMNPQVVADFSAGVDKQNVQKSANMGATLLQRKHNQAGVRIWQLDSTSATAAGVVIQSLRASHPGGKYSPVFHDGPNSTASMRALPGNIIVYLNPSWDTAAVNAWLKTRKLEVVKKLEVGQNIYLIKTGPGLDALDTANNLYRSGEVKAAFPDWWQEVVAQ
jgi:hypothetical protein